MVFAIGLVVVTAVAPAASVVTAPMLTKVAAGTVGAAAGTAAGIGVSAAGAGVGAATAAGAATAGAVAVKATAGVATGVLTGAGAVMGPAGWIMLGKSEYSWTCWKKIIHDDTDNNDGVPLSYIFDHENVKTVSNYEDHHIVENVWGEKFKIYYVKLPKGDIAAHAE